MNRQERAAIDRLPIGLSAWEVALVDAPFTIDGVDTEGMLVVAESAAGHIRTAGPIVRGEGLWAVLGTAFRSPAPPCAPSRPPRVLCADDALRRRLENETRGLGIPIERVPAVPAVDALLDSMRAHFRRVRAPGIDTELGAWAATLDRFARAAMWERTSDSVRFRFESDIPELAEACALVLGLAGEQIGIALFPTAAAHERFRALADIGDRDELVGVDVVNLYLDPEDALDPTDVERVTSRGLVVAGDLYPHLLGVSGGKAYAPDVRAQRVMLSALQAICALAGRRDLEDVPASAEALTCLGRVRVRSVPGAPERLLAPPTHTVTVGPMRSARDNRELRGIVVKMAKRDAARLAQQLASVDAMRIEPDGDGYLVRVSAGSRELGALFRFDARGAKTARDLAQQERAILGISGGGGSRRLKHLDDVLLMTEVRIGAARPLRHDPVFDRPIAEWPKASETLLEFAAAGWGDAQGALPARALQSLLELTSLVWNATTTADYLGQPSELDKVRGLAKQLPGPPFPVDALIAAKREGWRGDPRIFGKIGVRREHGELRVEVSMRLPDGYTTGG